MEKPTPPDGYKLLDGYFDDEIQVKRDDLTFDISTDAENAKKGWNKAKVEKHRRLGTVKNYWFVARKI